MAIGADINWAFAVGSEERCGLVSMLAFPSTSEVTRNKYVFPDVSRLGGIVIEVFAVLNVVEDKNSTVPIAPTGKVPPGTVVNDVTGLMMATL